ncbi:ligand-dependent nuclear receptor-interacting factor 1 [Platichthys flesus]|uniref:ligand-dependent nuclear receptor-interacting factor 1 n=1 Tax=Platichthys flesus TaxID=8260 RepID=UPI002DB98CB1|nr:ligand-dependent nuclear receptor-interacting factor 1 [Platichthys flesus]
MFPTRKHKDAVTSGAGVFYQAMPAVGADGKKIMTLIPVKLVNGQFIRYEIRKPSVDSTTQKAVNISSAPLPVKKVVTNVSNVLSNRGVLDPANSRNNPPQQQQTESLMSKVPITPATNCVNSVRLPYQLPVMVKSPALPKGQLLQIPPNAHVRTLPASKLPPGIKKQIFNSSADSTPDVPSVVFVSPVTTVSQCAAPPWDSGSWSPRLPSQTEKTAKISKPRLKLIPKASQGPNGPTRWVIEEEDPSAASYVDSYSVTSQIIRSVAKREKMGEHYNVSESNLDKNGQEQDNALIMYNGKVFFVGKKSSLLFQQGHNDAPTAATTSSEVKETTEPLFQHPVEPAVPQTQQDISIIISDEPDEVIDLCDDDTQDDSQQATSVGTSAVSHQDDDNVIFVSYIPPKSEADSTQTQTTIEKDNDLLNTSCSNSLSQEKSSGGRADADGRDDLTGGRSGTVENVTHVWASAGTSVNDDEGSNMNSKQSTSTQQEGSMGGDVDPETPADGSSAACSHKQEEAPPGCQTSSPAPPPCKMADRQLSQIFGITVDVKICLQRIDEASAGLAEARISEFLNSTEDQHEPANGLKQKELFQQDFYRSCENQNDDVKREEGVTEWEQRADAATVTAHTDVMSFECAVFKLNKKPLSELGQSPPKGASCGVENTTLIGYVEPIDEDFFNANEIAELQDVVTKRKTQTCVDLNTNTSRIGRTRKRTMCPCCVPGTPEPAVKFKSEELEKWACRTEQISKKGTRTKAARKGVITSGNSCLTVRNNQKSKTHEVPAWDSLSSASTDTDELHRDRQIQRLKKLLKEREAALELMEYGTA